MFDKDRMDKLIAKCRVELSEATQLLKEGRNNTAYACLDEVRRILKTGLPRCKIK